MNAKHRRTNLSNEKARLKYFLWTLIQKYQPNCYHCGEPFVYEDVLPPRGTDNLTEHHIDGDHQNMSLKNRTLDHRVCHKSFHVKDNINKRDEGEPQSKADYLRQWAKDMEKADDEGIPPAGCDNYGSLE